MNNLMKKFFRSSLVTSIFLLTLGGLLVFASEITIISISYVIGGALIALGIVALIRYVNACRTNTNSELDILYGIVTMLLGSLVIMHPKALASFIPVVIGISIVVSSSTKLQYALELKKDENELWVMTMVVAIISTICGVVLIFNPFEGATMITQVIGIFIIIYAILDLISTLTIRRNVNSIQKAIRNNIEEADIIDEEINAEIDEESSNNKKKNKKEK